MKFASESPTYVFAPTIREVNALSDKILKILENEKLSKYLQELPTVDSRNIKLLRSSIKDELGDESPLLKYLDNGFIVHHSKLPENVKINIENALRDNELNLVIGTSTLAQGANFPIKTLLIKGLKFSYGNGVKTLDKETFWNMCGRVGRGGKENNGRVLLFVDHVRGSKKSVETYRNYLRNLHFRKDTTYLKEILESIKEKYEETPREMSFEKFCCSIGNQLIENELDDIDLVDTSLLPINELYNENYDIDDMIKNIIRFLLTYKKFPKCKDDLESFLRSRLQFLRKEYKSKIQKKMYKMGLNLRYCKVIDENSEELYEN